jgi:hypothetical protein
LLILGNALLNYHIYICPYQEKERDENLLADTVRLEVVEKLDVKLLLAAVAVQVLGVPLQINRSNRRK